MSAALIEARRVVVRVVGGLEPLRAHMSAASLKLRGLVAHPDHPVGPPRSHERGLIEAARRSETASNASRPSALT